jgi:hypothetical protein
MSIGNQAMDADLAPPPGGTFSLGEDARGAGPGAPRRCARSILGNTGRKS